MDQTTKPVDNKSGQQNKINPEQKTKSLMNSTANETEKPDEDQTT